MRSAVDCLKRAEECRRLAKVYSKPELAETWDLLAKQRQERLRWKITALADRCRNVLSLSEIAPKDSAEVHSHENAA
jgi:hypothetical protein